MARSLEDLELFAGLATDSLASHFGTTELATGQELWRQGQTADALYIVVTGSLEVVGRLPGEREIVGALRQAERPQARLAAHRG